MTAWAPCSASPAESTRRPGDVGPEPTANAVPVLPTRPSAFQRWGLFRILITMQHTTVTAGSRPELVAELRRAIEGWAHFGKPELSEQALAGADAIEAGAPSVRVGHVEYRVTE